MPQKIDIHGFFLDPETITDLQMRKRISVFYPVFHEVRAGAERTVKSFFGRISSAVSGPSAPSVHVLRFDHQEPYGIILADAEQPDPSSYAVNFREAVISQFLRSFNKAGKNLLGHFNEMLKIDVSGDREFRILQSGRNVKSTTIREIPAKVKLLSGQWIDVFKSSPDFDFQGGTPYAVTDVSAASLMISTNDRIYVLYGAGVDASNEEVLSSYQELIGIYNRIQEQRDKAAIEESKNRPAFQLPQININFNKIELPKLELPKIRFQSPFIVGGQDDKEKVQALESGNSTTEEISGECVDEQVSEDSSPHKL